jgi:3-isopropylmalate/(R)-2-methylmalate dehydratase large subunit
MGKTMAEKILANSAGLKSVSAGDIITARIDYAMLDDILGPRVIIADSLKELGVTLWDAKKVVVICDHYVPSGTIHQADIVAFTRRWAKEYGIKNYYEGQGPCHQILAENGFFLPGTVLVGTDSHTCTGGAFGCFGTGIGSTEMLGVLIQGELWLRVPHSMSIIFRGDLPKGVMAKDLILKVMGDIGHSGATYMSMEFSGDTIEALSMDERMCISNMAVEAGAKVGLIAPDKKTEEYLRLHGCIREYMPFYSDADAQYQNSFIYETEQISPQVACPHNVDNVCPVDEVIGEKIDCAYIGSCTGGRLNDLAEAADLLRGKHIAENCRLLVSPCSQKIWREAANQGILSDLAEAGAIILAPSCGACLGVHSGVLAAGEKCISTTNRNFKGRMGSKESLVYLASPATVAASALMGKITDCRELY